MLFIQNNMLLMHCYEKHNYNNHKYKFYECFFVHEWYICFDSRSFSRGQWGNADPCGVLHPTVSQSCQSLYWERWRGRWLTTESSGRPPSPRTRTCFSHRYQTQSPLPCWWTKLQSVWLLLSPVKQYHVNNCVWKSKEIFISWV